MYKEDKKKAEMDELWAKYGNQNINNSNSNSLDEKYWVNHK